MYHRYNPNPTGRNVGDCTVRAISKAMNQDWNKTYWGLCIEGGIVKDMPSSNAVWGEYLKRYGYTRQLAPDGITVGEFAENYHQGTYILALSGHVVCVQDGIIYDTWDSENEIVLYFWRKGKP